MATINYKSSDFENPYYEKSDNGNVKIPSLLGSFENKFKQIYGKGILVKPIIISTGYSSCYIFEDIEGNLYSSLTYKGAHVCKNYPTLGCEPLAHQKIQYTDKILHFEDHFVILDSLTYELYQCIILNLYNNVSPLVRTIACLANNVNLSSDLFRYRKAATDYLSRW